jgi:PilZ domain
VIERSSEHPERASERRLQPRLPVRGVAHIKIKRRSVKAETVDISSHGVCLTLPQPLEVGSSCQLDLAIEGEEGRRISVVARVCFCLRGKNGYRVGLNCALAEFIDEGSGQ